MRNRIAGILFLLSMSLFLASCAEPEPPELSEQYCNSLSEYEGQTYHDEREECFYDLALQTQRIDLCDRTDSNAGPCIAKIGLQRNLTDEEFIEQCKAITPRRLFKTVDGCLAQVAQIKRDLSFCDYGDIPSECVSVAEFMFVFDTEELVEDCLAIEDEDESQKCLFTGAIEAKDQTICDLLDSPMMTDTCTSMASR